MIPCEVVDGTGAPKPLEIVYDFMMKNGGTEFVYLPAEGRRLIQKVDGYAYTICSGEMIYEDGEPTGALPGKLIRGPQPNPSAWALRVAAAVMVMLAAGCAPHITRSELARRIETGSAPPILDVRSAGEYAESHVPGAVHVPFYSVLSRSDELPTKDGEPLVVYCEHGPRAGLARAGLWMAGAGEIRFLEGHMTSWKSDGLPVESVEPVERTE